MQIIPGELNRASGAWQGGHQLKALLPVPCNINVRCGPDRYGFSHYLAATNGIRSAPRSFANWVHGWIWDEEPTARSLHCSHLPNSVPIVVRNDIEKQVLIASGFQDVWVGGLPFAYVRRQHAARNEHALLAIPPHSSESESLSSGQADYLDYLESLKMDFDGIYVSVFSVDWEKGVLPGEAIKRGLFPILGAKPDDRNAMLRIRSMFDAFRYVTSNSLGSHLIYALYSGATFSLGGPLYVPDPATYAGSGRSEAEVLRMVEVLSPAYIESRFRRFLVRHPVQGVSDQSFGAVALGCSSRLSFLEIQDVLGWSWSGQVKGYVRGSFRRLGRELGRSE